MGEGIVSDLEMLLHSESMDRATGDGVDVRERVRQAKARSAPAEPEPAGDVKPEPTVDSGPSSDVGDSAVPTDAGERTSPALALAVTRRARVLTVNQTALAVDLGTTDWERLLRLEDQVLALTREPLVRSTLVSLALEQMPASPAKFKKWLPNPDDWMRERAGEIHTRVDRPLKVELQIRLRQCRHQVPGLTLRMLAGAAVARLLSQLEEQINESGKNADGGAVHVTGGDRNPR